MGMLVGHGVMKDDLQGQSQEQCWVWVEKKWQKSAGGNFKQKSLDAASRCWLHFDPGAAKALNKRDLEGGDGVGSSYRCRTAKTIPSF